MSSTNWEICALCQKEGEEGLRDPMKSKNGDYLKTFGNLEDNLRTLHSLNALPLNIKLDRLDNGAGIKETLRVNSAKWHKKCRVLCSSTTISRATERAKKSGDEEIPIKRKCLRSGKEGESTEVACLFCKDDIATTTDYTVTTDSRYAKIRRMAVDLEDDELLRKLANSSMNTSDFRYHKQCITSYYTTHRSWERHNASKKDEGLDQSSLGFTHVLTYIEEQERLGNYHHKLSHLIKIYGEIAGSEDRIHSTRFKEKLLASKPDMEEHKSGKEIILSFNKGIGKELNNAQNKEDDGEILLKAAKIIRDDMFDKNYEFSGSLDDAQYDQLPRSLITLLEMILTGSSTPSKSEETLPAVSTLTQLIIFNAVKKRRKTSQFTRHNHNKETAFPLYLGLLVHNKTRRRDLVDFLFESGLSVGYDRVVQIATQTANSVIDRFVEDGFVCPTSLRSGLMTTGQLDNIDHNTSATSASSSFHGTSISLTQHMGEGEGVKRHQEKLITEASKQKTTIQQLPEAYSRVPQLSLPSEYPEPKKLAQVNPPAFSQQPCQTEWLNSVSSVLNAGDKIEFSNISWSAYFACLQGAPSKQPAISGILPLFRDSSHSPAMIKHGMDIIKQATISLNPDQIPVITLDQPLFTIAKKIQWAWPDIYGEDTYVVMMGGLHIEMCYLNVIGDLCQGSGLAEAIAKAGVSTEGRIDAILKGNQTSRGQWVHQVTACALFELKKFAFQEYKQQAGNSLSFEEWTQDRCGSLSQFQYWSIVLDKELLFLDFLKSQRNPDLLSYISSLIKMVRDMFLFDHYQYARWLTVHVADLLRLKERCPSIWEQFQNGTFVTQKTSNPFSCLAHDQIHEQLNGVMKGDGGIIGITENESALNRWMTSGPEITRLLQEYESKHHKTSKPSKPRHHEQTPSIQKQFVKDVQKLTEVISAMGNPFTSTGTELITLDTKVIMPEKSTKQLRSLDDLGRSLYEKFVKERLFGDKSVYDPIPKNNIQIFNIPAPKTDRQKTKLATMKDDVHLFSKLYIASQSRPGELDNFFMHENLPWPPALAEQNKMRRTTKSDLMECLESLNTSQSTPVDAPDALIIDGAALIHCLDPKYAKKKPSTFKEYSLQIFLPHIEARVKEVKHRLDVVWDVYFTDSLKSQTRDDRRTSFSSKYLVEANTLIPQNWSAFLQVDSNKSQLFRFLGEEMKDAEIEDGKCIITTIGSQSVIYPDGNPDPSLRCTHEESDTRMILHACHAYEMEGFRNIWIQANDTDVAVLGIAHMKVMPGCQLWMKFGNGNNSRNIALHLIEEKLTGMTEGLLFFHAFTGCDTTSSFHGIGKKTAWGVWKDNKEEFTPVFEKLSYCPDDVSEDDLTQLERFTVQLYSKSSQIPSVNEARMYLFSQKNRQIENIPPTQSALLQHIKRAVYQAGYIWGQAHIWNPTIPSEKDWGWIQQDGQWKPFWTSLPEAGKACRELIKCGCRSDNPCRGNCKCRKANLKCTTLCSCGGRCIR